MQMIHLLVTRLIEFEAPIMDKREAKCVRET